MKNDKTLFLLAASRAAGKSTLLKHGFDRLGELVGPNHIDQLLETDVNQTRVDLENFTDARNRQSFFRAGHLMFLRAEKPANRSQLIHVDIYNVLRNLAVNPDYLTSQQRKKLVKKGIYQTRQRDYELLEKRRNDFILRNFLKEPFFQEFGRLVIITLNCDYEQNQNQAFERDGEYLYGYPDPSAKEIHSEIIDCWKRNVLRLKPFANFEIIHGPNGYEILPSRI